jgi:hypothetical protein
MNSIPEVPGSARALACSRARLAVGPTRAPARRTGRAIAPGAVDAGANRRTRGRVRSPLQCVTRRNGRGRSPLRLFFSSVFTDDADRAATLG